MRKEKCDMRMKTEGLEAYASFDATKIKNCPYCGNKYEITSDDWALVELK